MPSWSSTFAGITHRDLKPANVLLQDGICRLTDFGLACVLKAGLQPGIISGTPCYMAPETFAGSYSAESDLWAVGVLLYELLAGSHPFPIQDPMALIHAIQTEGPVPLPDTIPTRLRGIVARLLAKSPADRFASAVAVREALRSCLQPQLSPIGSGPYMPAGHGSPVPGSAPHNLPTQPTSFVGREAQIAALKALLEKTHFLTLTGAGGCGKTRLSLEVAAEVLADFPDGVWLVELAPLSDPALVANSAANVLGTKETPGAPVTGTIVTALRDRRLLLVLDNCEHVLDAAAHLVDAVLRGCPQVKVLVSSREALGTAGETAYRVPSLSLPDLQRAYAPDSLARYESVRLFVERAVAVNADFRVTEQNAHALVSVCHRLDGIPLAIELAAARARGMSVEQIEARLDQRFHLLTGGSRTALPRQRTLRSLLDWSYDLLDPQERLLLHRLSVFASGWTLDAAEKVCSGEGIEAWSTLDLLLSLTDKSLASYAEQEGQPRYHLLQTVRHYAQDRLGESGEAERVRRRHQEFYAAFVLEAERHLQQRDQAAWLHRLETEHDNLRATLEWRSDEASLRIVGAIWPFWVARGHVREGRMRLAAALDGAEAQARTELRAKALIAAGALAWEQGDYAAARTGHEEALAIQRELGNKRGINNALEMLGSNTFKQGEYSESRLFYHDALALSRELGSRHAIGNALHGLGAIAWMEGDAPTARTLFNESLNIRREIGNNRAIAYTLDCLGGIARLEGDLATARTLHGEAIELQQAVRHRGGGAASLNGLACVSTLEGSYAESRALHGEALAILRELGDRAGIATSLNGFASLAIEEGQPRRAAILWGAAEALREAITCPLPPPERPLYDRQAARARAALPTDFEPAWSEGRTLTTEQAIEFALLAHPS